MRQARTLAPGRERLLRVLGIDRIEGDFDAIVGRVMLMFLPDPAATLRSLGTLYRHLLESALQAPLVGLVGAWGRKAS